LTSTLVESLQVPSELRLSEGVWFDLGFDEDLKATGYFRIRDSIAALGDLVLEAYKLELRLFQQGTEDSLTTTERQRPEHSQDGSSDTVLASAICGEDAVAHAWIIGYTRFRLYEIVSRE
jgi:hypothetical protein